jgi:hypothetical protein
LRTSIKSKI